MADFYDELNILVGKICSEKIGKTETEQTIKKMKSKYGDDAFPGFHFKKEPKPWTKEYFNELKTRNITGACSEDFILHMAEVSEYLSKQKKRTKCIVIIVIIIAVIIAAFIMLKSGVTISKETTVSGKIMKLATIQYKVLFI